MAKGPAILREINEKRVLAFLRVNKTSSRQEITEALDLSKNTVSLIVDKFIKDGVVREIGIDSNGVGRPRTQLALVPEIYQSVGMFVQDTYCEVVITDYLGAILESRHLAMNSRNAKTCLAEITRLYTRLEDQYPNILGLGIAVPGLVDPARGLVHYSSHLGWRDVAVADSLAENVSVPLQVLNRVKAAALSPVKIIPQSAESTFYIRIDEGVGGAFMLGSDIVHGFSRTAGEIGHLVVKADGPMCTCGQQGCLESLVAVPTVLDILGEHGIRFAADEQLSNLFQELSVNVPFHPEIERVMSETGDYVGSAIATIVNLLNPQYIVIDSPYNLLECFRKSTLSTVAERALRYPSDHTHIVFVQTSLSSAWGMALSVIHQYETTNFSG